MRAIFEELENNIARLIPDNGSNPIEVKKWELPDEARIGDVFEIHYKCDQQIIEKIYLIPNERIRRLEKMKLKREALLKRTKDNEQT
ncbi:Protein of unknown function [Carnobacterium iners]|uniref:Uncharacterized protein n=1 Tax=Carnobacterium iners TaxID=1073423 RepID=A0A1X7NP71_9LACT|nr:DUF3006 family protein [Carnobacterium iners]SEK29040.1 Protein of unknown function [Carnobacterium iners]SMH39798.1 Protein of unknown function [Carnobacterium iners]